MRVHRKRGWVALVLAIVGISGSASAQVIKDPAGLVAIGTTSSDNPYGYLLAVGNGGTAIGAVAVNTTGGSLGTVALSGQGWACGDVAVSGTGPSGSGHSDFCAGDGVAAASGTGSSRAGWAAASGTDSAWAVEAAASGTDDAYAPVVTARGWDAGVWVADQQVVSAQPGDRAMHLPTSAGSLLATALAMSEDPGAIPEALVGLAMLQFEDVTGLQMRYDADLTNSRLAVGVRYGATEIYRDIYLPSGTVLDHNDSSRDDSESGFTWRNTAKLRSNRSQGCGCADGQAIFTFYNQERRAHAGYDFYASSFKSSITPYGVKFTSTIAGIGPQNEVELIDFDPSTVSEWGSGGSLSLGATLTGQFAPGGVDGGGGFSIDRTWNFSAGWAGGGASSDDLHWGYWSKKGGVPYTVGVAGVETWKMPRAKPPQLGIGAIVYYKR